VFKKEKEKQHQTFNWFDCLTKQIIGKTNLLLLRHCIHNGLSYLSV